MQIKFTPDNENAFGVAMLAGRVVGTVIGSDGHITVRAMAKRKNENGSWINCPFADASHVFFAVPSPDGDFADKIGTYYPESAGGKWAGHWFTDRNQTDDRRVKAAHYLIATINGDNEGTHILKSERCARCSKELTHPDSIFAMFGPECVKKVGAFMPNRSGTDAAPHMPKAPFIPVDDTGIDASHRERAPETSTQAATFVPPTPNVAAVKPADDTPKPAAIVEQDGDKLTIVLRKGDDPQMVLTALDNAGA